MQLIVQKKGYRLLPFLLLAVAAVLLLLVARDSLAVHNEGMLEMDGNVALDGGDGFDEGTNNCPFSVGGADSGDPDDCIVNNAAFDWADTCDRTSGGALDGYITVASSLPSELASADVICGPDFIQGATDDTSYHTGSDKDFQEIGGGGNDRWHCTTSANATSKADILNAYAIVASVDESGDPHQLVYIGAERDSEHGSVFNGYWILSGDIAVPDATTTDGQLDCTPSAPLDFSGLHNCGDVLVRFNYTSGGRIGGVLANEWVAPSPDFVGTFVAANGCDQLTGAGDADSDGVPDNADDCTASQQASAETHTVPGGFLCERPPAQGDCRSAADQTAPGDDLCGRVNGETDCTIAPKQNDPNPPPCSGPDCFSTAWEPGDSTCPPPGNTGGVTPPTFSEMGIDLTGLDLELPCIATLIVESRSSPAIDATLKDFALAPTGEDCASSIDTEIHNASHEDIEGNTVLAGTVIHDQATVTPTGPASAPNATGTVTFHRFSTIDCTGSSVDEVVTITDQIPAGIPTGTDGFIESADFTTVAGKLSYTAEYSGDDTYSGATMPEGHLCEPLTVEVQPVIETDANPNAGHIGDTLQDTATLSGGSNPTGSITFKLFAPGVDPCDPLSTAVYTETVSVSGNGPYSTVTGFVATTAGTYEWTASYSGDLGTGGPNRPDDSTCPATAEQVIIINPSTVLTKSATPSVVTTVVYDYTETNDGDDPLTNPVVTDDQCGVAAEVVQGGGDPFPGENTGDLDGNDVLDVGETWNFTCTQIYNGTGTFTNVATGTAIDSQGFTVQFCGAGVTTIDNVNLIVCDPDETATRSVTITVTVQ